MWSQIFTYLAGGSAAAVVAAILKHLYDRRKTLAEADDIAAGAQKKRVETSDLIMLQLQKALTMSDAAFEQHRQLRIELTQCEIRCAERDLQIAVHSEQINKLRLRVVELEKRDSDPFSRDQHRQTI